MITRTLDLAAQGRRSDLQEARHYRYSERSGPMPAAHSLSTKVPRNDSQMSEFRKRDKPTVILKMKPVANSSGQPNILRKPQPMDIVVPRRQRSNPQRQKQSMLMARNFPFFFAKEDPVKLKDAPEWYQKIGKRTDGLAEKNMHTVLAGKSFPVQKQSVYGEASKAGAKKSSESVELHNINERKVHNGTIKHKVTKDTLQNLIYELKQRDERFEQTSRTQNERGLGYRESTIRGNSLNVGQRNANVKQSQTLPFGQPNASQDTRFSLPTSVKQDYNDQLILFTELPLDIRRTLAKQQKTRVPQRKMKSVFCQEQQDEASTAQVNKVLADDHNVKIKEAIYNRNQDDEDHYPMVDPRVKTMFEPSKQGKVDPYSQIMKSFQAGDLRYKHQEMPNKKRFGVLEQDAGAKGTMAFQAEQSARKKGQDVSGNKKPTSDIGMGQGLIKPDNRVPQDDKQYGNSKNYSNLVNNYSYKVQLQRQINKARKHQPNASLSKLIDLSDFRADHKLSKDMVIKNIAENFKQHRINLRQGVKATSEHTVGSRTPHQIRTQPDRQLLPAGQSILKNFNNSVSPGPKVEPGSLSAQKEWSGQASEEWKMNTSGKNHDWNLIKLNTSINSRTSPNVRMTSLQDFERMSQSSQQSLGQMSRSRQTSPRILTQLTDSAPKMKSPQSMTTPMSMSNQQDPTSLNPSANPFKMSDRNRRRDKACSILFKAPRGPDKSAEQHYTTAHKNIENRARSSTEQHLLPAVQKSTLSVERDFIQVRNKKVSVGAINGDSRPLKYGEFKLKDPEPLSLTVQGKKMASGPKNYRHGDVLRDSIQSIHQERIAAQVAQTQMHLQHKRPKNLPQFQTLQVFKEKRPACFTSPDERLRASTIYHKTIAGSKDLNLMKVTAAGVNRDTQMKTPHELRQGLLEHNFSISFQKELDQYKTNNSKLFPRYKLSAALLDEKLAEKQGNKDQDLKTHWNLVQVSQMSQRDTPAVPPNRNEADKKLLQQFQERQAKNEVARRESVSSRISMGNQRDLQRLSPAPLISHSPQHDQMRSGVVLAQRDLQVKSRFAPQRNESSRMSITLHSEKSKWYPREATSPMSTVMRQQSNINFSMSRRENSLAGNFPTMQNTTPGTKQDVFETRSAVSRHSSFHKF